MATHGAARQATIRALRNREPFKRSGFAMSAVEGAVSGTGEMPEDHAAAYRTAMFHNDVMYTVLSYATPIAYVLRDGTVVHPDARYSLTSSHHQGLARTHLS